MQTVLISGGGIAGPVLAHWLHRHGFGPTVVERAPGPRPGGQAVDIRGVALDVIERMGLLEQARGVRTRMRGMSILDPEGHEVDRSTESTFSSGRLDSDDIELLREDLVRMVQEHTRADAEYLFGDSIAALQEDGAGVRVDFVHGASRTFDLVIGADGLHSTVRRLAFGPEERFIHHLGSYLSVFGADNFLGLDDWQVWLRDGDAGFGIMPVRDNTELRIAFGFESGPLALDQRDSGALRRLVVDKLSSLSWEGSVWPRLPRRRPTSTATPWPRSGWTTGRAAGWPCSGTRATAPPRSRGRAPAWPSWAPTSWPTASPGRPATTVPRSPATSGGCAPSSLSTRPWPPRIPVDPPPRPPSHTPRTHSRWAADSYTNICVEGHQAAAAAGDRTRENGAGPAFHDGIVALADNPLPAQLMQRLSGRLRLFFGLNTEPAPCARSTARCTNASPRETPTPQRRSPSSTYARAGNSPSAP